MGDKKPLPKGWVYSPPKGAGWGGPAKGASTSRIKKGDPDGITKLSRDPDRMAMKADRREALETMLFDLAHRASNEHVQVAAAGKLLDVYDRRDLKVTATAAAGSIRVEIIDAGSPDASLAGPAAVPPAGHDD